MIAEEENQQQTENKNQNKEFKMATEMKIRRMSDVQLQEVAWLWKPYTPFGKITIIQGDPGEGKTTLTLRVAVACSTGTALPRMEACAPFDVIYQTAEDGLGDTVKPRLIEAGADESRILNIVEDAQIAYNTNDESKKVELSALTTTASKNVGSKKKGGTYDSTSTKAKEENGFISESKSYHTLRTCIGSKGSVVLVSGNGYRANENQGGDDSLGYDIWYSDENGKKHYVEVKGSTSENVEFVLTKNELEFAEQHVEEYEIWYVRIVEKQPTIPYELGNLLLLGEEETFFNNSKFAVENSEFRIRAMVLK